MDKCWLLLPVAAADCCCWLLLLVAAVDYCCWLLLLVAAVDCFCWLLLLIAGWLLVAAGILLAGRKVFEYFRDVDDLRLRQFCGRKSLWIFQGYWWEESGREFRLREVGWLMVASEWILWSCTGILYSNGHVFFQFWARANRIIWRGNPERVGWLCKAEFAAKTGFGTVFE